MEQRYKWIVQVESLVIDSGCLTSLLRTLSTLCFDAVWANHCQHSRWDANAFQQIAFACVQIIDEFGLPFKLNCPPDECPSLLTMFGNGDPVSTKQWFAWNLGVNSITHILDRVRVCACWKATTKATRLQQSVVTSGPDSGDCHHLCNWKWTHTPLWDLACFVRWSRALINDDVVVRVCLWLGSLQSVVVWLMFAVAVSLFSRFGASIMD